MLTLVTGGSASGKSEYAESLVCASANQNRWYIATMVPYDQECEARIAKHREMRKHKGFQTVEQYLDLAALQLPAESIVLLECMSNLVANELFDPQGAGAQTEEHIMEGVTSLCRQAEEVIIVTNEIFSDGVVYDGEMNRYLQVLGNVNQRLAAQADVVVEVVCGIPIYHQTKKGGA